MTDTFDPDVIAAAKAIYGNRLDQKYGGNRRWRQLVADYPQLAEAAKPVAVQRSNGPKSEIDHWRDEQEQIHRHMEAWARSQTPSRKKYYYRGKSSVLHDANYTTPGWIKQYECWHEHDRGRWGTRGAGPDEMTYAEDHVEHRVRGQDLRNLHAETDGDYSIEDGVGQHDLLEVCRVCRKRLVLKRDADGAVVRGKGGQPEFCPTRCKADLNNARKRARRRIGKPQLAAFTMGSPDQIARRWADRQSYWSASGIVTPAYKSSVLTAKDNRLTPGWDRVSTRWRYVDRAMGGSLKQVTDTVWLISQ